MDYGLGALPSPPDERDWDIGILYATAGIEQLDALPASYIVPAPYPPVLNQHTTPMCVAFSSATLKGYEDLRDTGAATFDEASFFAAIGGTANGAVVRNALARLVTTGYPEVTVGRPEKHKIAAYYSVPVTQADIQSALVAFGPVLLSTTWHWSWFHPVNGVLPAPDAVAGGHAIVAIGFDSRGLRLRNSWGALYGLSGDVFLPWAYLSSVKEAWKAIDQIIVPAPTPKPITYTLHIAHNAVVKTANLSTTGCIRSWTSKTWTGAGSSAGCRAPVIKRGCASGQATVVYVPAGAFRGKWVRIGSGVTVTHS